MIAPLSLSNILTVLLSFACLWAIVPQARGDSVKVWRLAVPPSFATVQALVLLAGVFDATPFHDGEWIGAGLLGAIFGRLRGWSLPIKTDRMRDLVRLRPSLDSHLAALGLVVLSAIDFTSATLEDPVVPTDLVAAGAAFLAGYIGCRALSIGVRATRIATPTPSPSTPARTSLPPS
jgi:hypothetical protein